MKSVSNIIGSLKEIPSKYPAIVSAYIIYGYLFVAMIRFFIIAKHTAPTWIDVIEIFDALPFMWLLAMTLVKIIHIRSKLHESETDRIKKENDLHIKETQIETMKEVVLGLQHQINNPLAIIMLTIQTVKRKIPMAPGISGKITVIEEESQRIANALKEFSETQHYEIQHIGELIGSMAIPEKHAI